MAGEDCKKLLKHGNRIIQEDAGCSKVAAIREDKAHSNKMRQNKPIIFPSPHFLASASGKSGSPKGYNDDRIGGQRAVLKLLQGGPQ